MAAAHIFLSIAGSQFLGNMVTRATDKLTRKIGPRVIRALRNYNLREARGSPNISEASIKEVQHARKNAVSQFRSFRKSFERSSRTLNSFITRDLELTTKLDRAAGRIFAGPNSSKLGKAFAPSFTKHMKTVIANDLATMPVTYAMYQYDKSKYPEMKDTSFMKYYMQTIPYNLGFQASSAAVRTVTKVASSRLANKVAHSRFTPQAIESVLDIGQAAAAKVGAALSYHSTLKREMIDSTALRDFASVRGVQGIWHRLGHAHRSAASAARTPYATRVMDSDLFQRRMGEYYQQTSISQQDARRVGEEFNSMLDPDFKRSHAFGFLNKLLEPHNIRLQKEVAAPMLINRPQPNGSNQPAVITDFVRDRSRFEFVRNGIKDEKAYDFGIFNIDRLRDSVADFVEGSGFHTPFGFLKGLKITTGGFDFIRSDFKRNLSNAVVGGKARSFAVTPALAEIANNQPGISEIKETADYRKHAQGILRETFGLRSSEEAGVLLERMASSHNAKTIEQVSSTISSPFQVDLYSKRLVENAKHGSLPIEKGSFFFFNNKGYGTLITGGDTGRDYVATGLGRMTISTNENKSSIAEVMTRVLGSTKHGNEIYGLERTRKLSGHELYEQRKSMGITDEKELWGFIDTISERFDLGGGGTSVLDWIKGYYTKFKNPSYARNIFTSDVFVNEVSNLTSPTPDVSSAKWFIKTLDNVFSTSQERVSRKLFDSNTQRRRFWGVLDRQLSSFSEKVGAEFRHSEMSLNGITNISDALQRVNRYEEFANAFDSPNMVQFTGSLKKALTEKGSIKEALNTITFGDNITMFEKYESMLDHNFLIRAHQTGNPEVPATDVFFETARRLMPKSKMGDFSTYSKIISSHNKIISIRNIKGPDNAITDEYIEGLQSLGTDLDITDSTLGKRMSHLLMGKFGEFSDSVGFKRYKYIPHNTDAMFFFTDRGKMMPGLSRGKDVRGVETDYLTDSVTTGGATMMMALNTFNRAMGWLHLGMDDYRTPRDMLTNFVTKRVLPVGGLIAGMDAVDNFVDNSGLFEGTPLSEGIYQVPMNVYAGVRMASAGVLDAAGVTSVAKYTEDLLPGSINSPLSGAVRGIAPFMAGAGLGYHMGGMKGGMTGGLIGGAVGIMLGGGPLGLFDSWDISQSRAEVIQEFKGEKEVSIKKGRFWEISSGNFWGNQLSYFRPHLYHLMRSDYKDSPNYKTSMFDEIASYIDPSVYSRKHYYSRPSLEHPGLLSNIPIIGPAINLGNTEAHREDVDMTQLSRDREEIRAVYAGGSGSPGEALAMASGTGPSEYLTNNFYPDPRSNSSINSRLSDTFYNFKEVAGLRGFLAETFQESLTGNKQLFADQPTIEANAIGSMGRQFWDLNLGGIAGLSEGIRRIFPRKTADIEYFNPVRNLMPNWMPGSEFYVDFHHGDPFCVSEKTPILQETGYTKAANVEVGSLIYTHKGNWLPVKRKIKRALRKQEKAYSITLSGVKDVPLEFSEEHPLLIRRLYQCSFASSALCRPPVRNTNNFCDGKEICFSKKWLNNESIFLPVSECLVGDYVLYPIPQEGNLQQITITFKERLAPRSPETIKSENLHITSEFCWVLGLYLAEGSTAKSIKGKPQRLLFSMSIDEIDVLERVNRIILEKFGKEGSIKTKDNQAELVISSTKIAQIFDSLCPGNLYDKKIPNFIYSCSTSCRVSYLLGAYLGDGTVQRTELRYECANEKLVLDLRRLSFALGIPATYSNRDRIDKRTGVETRSFLTTIHIFNLLKYDISWLMYKQYKIIREFPRLPNINNFSDEQYIYQRITSITPISIDYVYGFEVDNDDSFCCFDFATHNTKIEMGEARLPGESYETVRSVAPVTPGEADLLGTTSEEAMGYYSGDIESIIPRYKWNDKIEQRKKLLIDSLKAQGSLIREQGIVYDTSKNITAYADATYRNDDGEIVPVKFAPYLGKEGGFLAGSASSLNAYLTLSGTRKGLLIGIDETGNTTQAIIFRDSERYEREAENDLQVRMRSYQELAKRRARGEPTAPGMHYSHMDRLKILSDVAYYSNQYKNELKIVKTQIKSGILGEQEALEVEDIENKVEKLKQKFLFIEDRFGGGEALTPEAQRRRDDVDSRYNAVERTIGKLWQDITTMRNPIISKLIGNRTALQAYQDDVVYGRAFKEWSSPIESYVKPFYQQMAVSSNPIQGALSGATAGFLMGGPLGAAVGGFGGTAWSLTGAQFMDHGSYIPGDIKKQRQIMAAADIAERDRYQMLYEQTGYNEYLYRMRNTIAGAMELNQPMTSGRMISVANKPERMYMKGILDDLNTENLQEARALLPQNISALLDRNVGIRGDVRPEDYTGGYFVESGDVVNTQVPIEDIVVKTMQLEGLNAKDVGLGWQRTLRRMNTMKEVGIEAPAMYQRNLPKRKIEYTIAPAQIKKVLDGILREYNPSITVHSGDGPLEVVVEIV